jgi:hypothetical protein
LARFDGSRPIAAQSIFWAFVVAFGLGAVTSPKPGDRPSQSNPDQAGLPLEPPTFTDAQNLFYSARYEAAAALTLALRSSGIEGLASHELRTSALLFQLKALLETGSDKNSPRKDALASCATCPTLLAAFFDDIQHGQTLARAMLRANPEDEAALFFLGKLNLNYVWLQLGPLKRKTGWDEYWEARRSLDAVLKAHPQHVRALVARAWIDYIVDTKMPRGGCSVAAARSERSPRYVTLHTSSQTSSATPKPSLRSGTCWSGNAT